MNARAAFTEADCASAPALSDGVHHLNRAQLQQAVDALATQLTDSHVRVLATLLDNSLAWIVADRAAAQAGVVHVPLPVFFTPGQTAHALHNAGVDGLLTSPAHAGGWSQAPTLACTVAAMPLVLLRLPAQAVALPAGTHKITYTSGSTGTPKGVCLSQEAIRLVVAGLVQAMAPLAIQRHLCALPLAVLLENIAGVLAPLQAGALCIAPPLAKLGLVGSSSFDPAVFHAAVLKYQPESVILLPQMLRAWTFYLIQARQRAPDCLKLVAVGGAAVGSHLLQAARACGIPAYEGYGLSEGASVQTLNLPGADKPGSAGRPLPHAGVRVADDGEIEISGSLFLGYLGGDTLVRDWWPTGDLGQIDTDGLVHLRGRKKNLLITSFGRNISPEWVETMLCGESAIGHAVVFGDGQPSLCAVLWPLQAQLPDAALQAAVSATNATLPDYARITRWVRARAPFTPGAGMATANGRPQRNAIFTLHANALTGHSTNKT
jgi:long-chain acyl-CoA synthetase